MKRPRLCRRWRIALALFLLPPLFWGTILAVTPTEWARTRIVARLSEATGRPIRLGSLRIGVLGAVYLVDLEIGAPGSGSDPWLKAPSTQINVSVLQLLAGQLEPSEIEIRGLALRVLRRQDGTLELADLLRSPRTADAEAHDSEECPGPASLEVRLKDARITLVDEAGEFRLVLGQVEGRATVQGRHLSITDLRGVVNEGTFELVASYDRTAAEPQFQGRLRARGVSLGAETNVLSYVAPVLSGEPGEGPADGRLDVNLYLKGSGSTAEAIRNSLVGQGTISIDPITFDQSRFFAELDRLLDLPEQAEVGSVKSDFVVKDDRVSTENLTVNIAKLPIVLKGWTDFDGRLDYNLRSESLTDRLPGKAREFLTDMAIDPGGLASLRLVGTLDAMHLDFDAAASGMLDGKATSPQPVRDRESLRELGRRFRDRILR